MRKTALIFAGVVLYSAAAAQTAGSNIALSEYPGPTCTKPQKPVLPMPSDRAARPNTMPAADAALVQGGGTAYADLGESSGDKRSYNDKVEQYDKDLRAYNANIVQFNSCIKTYIDNGNADLMRVQQKLNAVAAAVNAH